MSNTAKFIVFEGVEGVGKTTQVRLLTQYLTETHQMNDCIFIREPGNTSISEKIRALLLDKNNQEMSPYCEALLYAASRAQLVDEVILPALAQGKTVFCDRYYHSSFAYQGYGRELGEDCVRAFNSHAVNSCRPDAVLFLDLPPRLGFERKGGADKNDRMENLSLEFFDRVYNGFLTMAKNEKDIFVKIDCTGSRDQTHANIISALKQLKAIK